jgi:two-component sensor histidine kinase
MTLEITPQSISAATLKKALTAFRTKGDSNLLERWAYEEGRGAALDGAAESEIAARVLKVVEEIASGTGALDGLQEKALGAAMRGYLAVKSAELAEIMAQETMQGRVADLTALHRIISAANSSLKLTDMLNEIVQAVVEVTHADICSIFLYEPEWDHLVLTATTGLNRDGVGNIHLRLGEGITGWSALIGKPVPAPDAWANPHFKFIPLSDEESTTSILAVPIVLFTKEKLVGVIDLHTFKPRNFSENEIKFLETVAGEIAIAIENARLYEQTDSELRQKVNELSTLQGVSAHIASTLNLTEVLALIAHQSAHLVRADATAIYELHRDAGLLELVAQYDLRDPDHSIHQWRADLHTTLPIEGSAIASAVIKGIPTPLPPDADAGLGLPFVDEGYGWLYCVPLVAPRGIMGGICLYHRAAKTLSDDQVRLLAAFAREAAIALENSRLYDAALRGLQVKSAMLQEMNHRVRNNLQTVAGLLSMQLRRMRGESDGAVAVRESISRVQSIAVVHDLMVNGDSEIDSISVYDLARRVADAVISTLTRSGFRLELSIEPGTAEQVRVGSHDATMLALLFNELISNAILHGFSTREHGKLSIRVRSDPREGRGTADRPRTSSIIRIEVEDDGVGLPDGFDAQKDGNLGLNIVNTLVVSDLRGTFEIKRREDGVGTCAVFTFKPTRI